MLKFAKEIKKYTQVYFSVVDVEGFNLEKCKDISNKLGIPLRIRAFGMWNITNNKGLFSLYSIQV